MMIEIPKLTIKTRSSGRAGTARTLKSIYAIARTGAVSQITNNNYIDESPQINDNGQLAWEGRYDGEDAEIFLWTNGQTQRLTDNTVWEGSLHLNNKGNVVWQREDPLDDEVWLYAGGIAAPITDNDIDDDAFGFDDKNQIYIGRIVNNVRQAYVYSTGQLTQLTTSDYQKYDGYISPDGRIVWSQSDGADTEIWTRTATPAAMYRYDFTYTYSNGDNYRGWVYAAAAKGYTVGKTWQVADENGGKGTYEITLQTEVTGGFCGRVHLGQDAYYDKETDTYYTPMDINKAVGSNFLGSEAGYIIQANIPGYYFSRYYEAEASANPTNYIRFDFKYVYGSGDYYTGRVYAPGNNGSNNGLYIGKTFWKLPGLNQQQYRLLEEGEQYNNTGYYTITAMATSSTTWYGRVYVDDYYDHETTSHNNPIHKGAVVGKNYLGSEADYITADKNPLYYFGPGAYWLNPDYRQFAYPWVVYEADKTVDFAQLTIYGPNGNNNNNYEPIANDKGQAVWYGWDGIDFEIYFFDKDSGVKQVTNNNADDLCPNINSKGQIVWTGWEGNDWDVFFYDPATSLTKQLSTNPNDDGFLNTERRPGLCLRAAQSTTIVRSSGPAGTAVTWRSIATPTVSLKKSPITSSTTTCPELMPAAGWPGRAILTSIPGSIRKCRTGTFTSTIIPPLKISP